MTIYWGMPVFLDGLFRILTAAIVISVDHDPALGGSTHFWFDYYDTPTYFLVRSFFPWRFSFG